MLQNLPPWLLESSFQQNQSFFFFFKAITFSLESLCYLENICLKCDTVFTSCSHFLLLPGDPSRELTTGNYVLAVNGEGKHRGLRLEGSECLSQCIFLIQILEAVLQTDCR